MFLLWEKNCKTWASVNLAFKDLSMKRKRREKEEFFTIISFSQAPFRFLGEAAP